jgi:hypothetical protein
MGEAKGMKYKPLSRRSILILVGLAVVGLLCELCSSFAILPESQHFGQSLRLTVTRRQAKEISRKYLEELGFSLEDYRSVTSFTTKGAGLLSATYVLRQAGMKETNRIFTAEFPFWCWRVRWFKPLEKEEINVWIDSQGKVCGLFHPIAEDTPGANLSPTEAGAVVEKFIENEGRFDLAEFKLIKSDIKKLQNRTDHLFLYEKEEPKIGEGRFRLRLRARGDRLFGYHYFFKVPEEFIREETKAGTRQAVIGGLTTFLFLALVLTTVIIFFIKFKRRAIRWRIVFILAGILTVWQVIGIFNNLSGFFFRYPTMQDLPVFMTQRILGSLTGIVVRFLLFSLLFAVIESLWREIFPKVAPLSEWFKKLRPGNWLSREYIDGCLVGYLAVGALLPCSFLWNWVSQRYLLASLRAHSQIPVDIFQAFIPFLSAWREAWKAALGGGGVLLLVILILKKFLKEWKWVVSVMAVLLLLVVTGAAKTLSEGIIKSGLSLLGLGIAVLLVSNYFRYNILSYIFFLYCTLLLTDGWYLVNFPPPYFIIHGIIILILAVLPLVLLFCAYLKKQIRSS